MGLYVYMCLGGGWWEWGQRESSRWTRELGGGGVGDAESSCCWLGDLWGHLDTRQVSSCCFKTVWSRLRPVQRGKKKRLSYDQCHLASFHYVADFACQCWVMKENTASLSLSLSQLSIHIHPLPPVHTHTRIAKRKCEGITETETPTHTEKRDSPLKDWLNFITKGWRHRQECLLYNPSFI